jgi:hypothetical protein
LAVGIDEPPGHALTLGGADQKCVDVGAAAGRGLEDGDLRVERGGGGSAHRSVLPAEQLLRLC